MSSDASMVSMKPRTRLVIEELNVHGWNLCSAGGLFGLMFGILSALLGSVLTATTWITGPQWHRYLLERDGTWLLFLTIPLLIFGAHCLDLLDRNNRGNTQSR